jgi:hypothetical protein
MNCDLAEEHQRDQAGPAANQFGELFEIMDNHDLCTRKVNGRQDINNDSLAVPIRQRPTASDQFRCSREDMNGHCFKNLGYNRERISLCQRVICVQNQWCRKSDESKESGYVCIWNLSRST